MAVSQTTAETGSAVGPAPRRRRSLFKRILFRLITSGLGLAVALVAVEVALRIWGWPSPGYYQDGDGPLPIRTTNAEGGFGRAFPGAGRLRHFDYDVPFCINRHGFRERDLVPKAQGERRIGLFGDSMTAGWGVLKAERFGEIWFNAVKDRLPNTTLWNFGSPGSAPLSLTLYSVVFLP